jgi:uncharacterized membrane protein YtjA (UPF0391 family)
MSDANLRCAATARRVDRGNTDLAHPQIVKLHRCDLSHRYRNFGFSEGLDAPEHVPSQAKFVRGKEDALMLNWAITFLVIALIAGILGLSGIAGAATQIAWILFVVFLVLFLVGLFMGRRPPV